MTERSSASPPLLLQPASSHWHLTADLCIVGAGISGIACAVTAAKLGHRVILADAFPWVGGQAVGVPIGTIAGLFSTGPRESIGLLSPLFAETLLEHLQNRSACWPFYSERARTFVIVYDEAELERVFEELLAEHNVQLLLGALLTAVERDQSQVRSAYFATRFGTVHVQSPFFVDASGDAALVWLAGSPCQLQPEVYGTQVAVLEGLTLPSPADATAIARHAESLLREYGPRYGLTRRDCRVFLLPPRQLAILNATHLPTPLNPITFWQAARPARREAEQAATLLRREFPEVFGQARLRRLGYPGIRQTRTIQAHRRLTATAIRASQHYDDAVGRAAWPIELHDSVAAYRWEPLPDGQTYEIPYSALLPQELENVLAIGRCIDADPAALSSVRVMGPCIAMGVAAAHAVDLAHAHSSSLSSVDQTMLRLCLQPNLEGLKSWWITNPVTQFEDGDG